MLKIFLYIIYILIIINKFFKKNIFKFINIKGIFKKFIFFFKNSNKKTINYKIFKKKIIIKYFGYTHCPDLCPQIIEKIINLLKIAKNFYKIIFIFISIDTKKDNCEIIQKYLNKFKINNIYGLTEKNFFLEKITKIFRTIYQIKNYNLNKYKIKHGNIIYTTNIFHNINFIKTKL